jgi:hypothetical protein
MLIINYFKDELNLFKIMKVGQSDTINQLDYQKVRQTIKISKLKG